MNCHLPSFLPFLHFFWQNKMDPKSQERPPAGPFSSQSASFPIRTDRSTCQTAPLEHPQLTLHDLTKQRMRTKQLGRLGPTRPFVKSGARTTRNTREVVKSFMLFRSWYSGGEMKCSASNLSS